jgi:hypothetical protein
MTDDKYILDKDKNIIPVELMEWANWFEDNKNNKHVRWTTIKKYNVDISTVFLGMDHGFSIGGGHTPVLFETMIFWNDAHDLDHYQERYWTWSQALEGHRETVRKVIQYIREKEEKGEKIIIRQRKSVEDHMEGMLKAIDSISTELVDPNTPMERLQKSLMSVAKIYRAAIEKRDS